MKFSTSYGIIPTLLLLLALLGGCSRESLPETPRETEGNQPMQLAISRASEGSAEENAIRTLRVMVFSADDQSMLYNQFYLTSSAVSTPPSDATSYLLSTPSGYQAVTMLPKRSIYVLVVANEITSLDGQNSFDYMRGQTLDYLTWYGQGGTLDIDIQAQSTSSNKGYIPMTAETRALAPYEWSADEGKTVDIGLSRNLVKINLQLLSNGLTGGVAGDWIRISSASVTHIPSYSYLGNAGIFYEDKLYSTALQDFASPLDITSEKTEKQTNILTFYVPEHLLSDRLVSEAQYAYIQINASFNSAGEVYNSIYTIPLGDGMQKLYDTPPTPINKLTRPDLTLTRNTEYNVKATVESTGKIQALQMNISIKEWEETINIDGDDRAPLLNISKITAKMDASSVRVYFWTNTQKVHIEASGRKNDAEDFVTNTLFEELSDEVGIDTKNFHLFSSSEDIFYPYNGYFDLVFNDPVLYTGNSDSYRITLNAGGLRRSVDVLANPVVGEVVFNTNGGKMDDDATTKMHEIHYAQLGGRPLTAANIDLLNPAATMTPPTGKTFDFWSYSLNEELRVTGSAAATCTVTPKGYTTTVYAIWK